MRKIAKIIVFILAAAMIFSLSACSVSDKNVVSNSYFIDRNSSNLPSGWEIYSPDTEGLKVSVHPDDSSGAPQSTASYLSVQLTNMSYVRVSQTIKVRPNTVYCFSYNAQLKSYAYSSSSSNVGIRPIILEDDTMTMSPNYVHDALKDNKSYWTNDTYKFYFNSNNNNKLTVALYLGGEDALCSGTMWLSNVSVKADTTGARNESSIYTVSNNNGYKISTAGEVLFVVLISLFFVALFMACVFLLSITVNKKNKQKKTTDATEINIPSDEELIEEQKILPTDTVTAKEGAQETPEKTIAVNESANTAVREDKFDRAKLDALFEENVTDGSELISDITRDLIEKEMAAEQTANPASGRDISEVETIEVKVKRKKESGIKGFRLSATHIFLLTMLAALVLRIVLAAVIRGFRADFSLFTSYMKVIDTYGFSEFYTRYNVGDTETFFSAGGVYMLSVINFLLRIFNINTASPLAQIFIKFPAIASDLLTATIIFILARKYINKNFAAVIAGFYMFNPAVFTNSAIWGAIDSVYTLFIVLSLFFLVEKKTIPCLICYVLAVLTKINALAFMPVFIIYYGYRFVAAIIFMIKNRAKGFAKNIKGEGAFVWQFPVYIISAIIIFYLLALPATISEVREDFFFPIRHLIIWAARDLTLYSDNAFNFFSLLGRNGSELGENFPTLGLSIGFIVLLSLIVAIIYITRQNRANIILLSSYTLFALTFFLVDMKPVYLLPAIALLLMSVCLNRDRRLLFIYGAMSLLNFINQALVLIFSHNLNNLPDYVFDETYNAAYNGSNYIDGTAGLVLNIIFGILMFVLFAYYTYVLLEIALGNRRKKIVPLLPSKKSFFAANKSVFY